jgi:hypothetical protein
MPNATAPFQLITLFARREPTQVAHARAMERAVPGSTRNLTDVAIYRDRECTIPAGRYAPDSARPRRNTRRVRLNVSVQPPHLEGRAVT